MRKAIDEAMQMCVSYAQFKKIMYQKGYIIQNDYNEKYPTIKSINDKKATIKRHQPLSPELKREIIRMEWYSREIHLIVKQNFETIEDVKTFIANTENKIKEITDKRQKYRNKLRNCKDEKLIAEYKK